MQKIINSIQSSLSTKITIITSICLLIFLTAIIAININGFNELKRVTSEEVRIELEKLTEEYYANYLNSTSVVIENDMESKLNELHILSGILQKFFTNLTDLETVISSFDTAELFRDNLEYKGIYYLNTKENANSLFVPSYMIDDLGEISPKGKELIKNTQILNLLLPSFQENGVDKIQIYFQGGASNELFRINPFTNLGIESENVYPDLFKKPIWETFNPGLASQWTERIKATNGDIAKMNELLRITPPVQDALSGDVILTMSQPIANSAFDEFVGTISFDLPIQNIVSLIEKIELSQTGFAFLTNIDGNIFAINEVGLSKLGLLSNVNSISQSEEGFNKLERTLKNSIFEDVSNLKLDELDKNKIEIITINGEEYLLATKKVVKYQSWSEEKSFYIENWNLTFLVPVDEAFSMELALQKKLNGKVLSITIEMIGSVIAVIIILLFLISKSNKHITRELSDLAKAVNEVKENEYKINVKIKSTDEVGVLAEAFSKLLGKIKKTFAILEEQNNILINEVKERKQKDKVINFLENFDSSTGLPNKKLLQSTLEEINKFEIAYISIIVIGLDEFRKVNEAYSWIFGDKLMVKIAKRLSDLTDKNGKLFKLSGDEFAVLYKGNKLINLIEIVESINNLFKKSFNIENQEITIGSSIGISSYPFDSNDPLDIFKYATNAMVHAKDVNKGNYEFYNAEINITARDRMSMIAELRNAMDLDEFELYYQPIVTSEGNEIKGMEALLRWNNGKFGNVSPNVFIPLAEKTKEIIRIGNWVIDRALKDTKELHENGYPDLVVAINVSIVQFLESDLTGILETAIKNSSIDPSKITIEITEGLFINDLNKILQVLNDLRKLNVMISVDDFGTGYSSLSYVKDLPLSKLKIDRSFINKMNDSKGKKIIDAIIGLAKNLELSVIAEGVETYDQLAYLKEKGCKEIQGYLFSKPITFDSFKEYISSSNQTKT